MRTDCPRNSKKPGARRRLLLAVLITLVMFGVLGAVVTLVPRDTKPPGAEQREIPPARQVDRKSLQ